MHTIRTFVRKIEAEFFHRDLTLAEKHAYDLACQVVDGEAKEHEVAAVVALIGGVA